MLLRQSPRCKSKPRDVNPPKNRLWSNTHLCQATGGDWETNVGNSWGNLFEGLKSKAISPRKQTCHFAPGFSIPSHLAADFGQHLFPADLGAYIRDAVTVAARLRWWDVGTFLSSVGVPAPNFPRPRSADSSPKWWCQPGFDTKLPALAMAHRSHLGRQHRCSWRPPRSAVCLMGFWGTDILMAFFVRRFWGWNPAPLQEQIDQTPNTKSLRWKQKTFGCQLHFRVSAAHFQGKIFLWLHTIYTSSSKQTTQQQTDHRNAPGPSFGLRDLCKAVDRCVAMDPAVEVVPISSPFPHVLGDPPKLLQGETWKFEIKVKTEVRKCDGRKRWG